MKRRRILVGLVATPKIKAYILDELNRTLAEYMAARAQREAGINRGLVRQEAFNASYSAATDIAKAQTAITRARERSGESAVSDLRDGLTGLERRLRDVQGRIAREEFLAAREEGWGISRDSVKLEAEANRRAIGPPRR